MPLRQECQGADRETAADIEGSIGDVEAEEVRGVHRIVEHANPRNSFA